MGRMSPTARAGTALLLAAGSAFVFLFLQAGPALFVWLEKVVPAVTPILERPVFAETVLLAWFVLASYWFFAWIDAKGWWKPAGLGLLLGYTWVCWAVAMFAWPYLMARYLRRRPGSAEGRRAIIRTPPARLAASQRKARECERLMREWPAVRPRILDGTAFLADVFRQSAVTIQEFVDYLDAEMNWSPEQVSRMFFRWYGIAHDFSYPMAAAGLDPSDPFHVRRFLLDHGTLDSVIEEVLAVMPSVALIRDAADAGTVPERPAPPVTGFYEPVHDRATRTTPEFREVMDAPTIDPEEWIDAR